MLLQTGDAEAKKTMEDLLAGKSFKAHDGEKTLEDAVANALARIEEKQYEAALIADGFEAGSIRKYGFAFQGKKCLIG